MRDCRKRTLFLSNGRPIAQVALNCGLGKGENEKKRNVYTALSAKKDDVIRETTLSPHTKTANSNKIT